MLYEKQSQAYLEECAQNGISLEDCNLIKKIWTDFTTSDFKYIFISLLFFMLSNVLRALRWHQLLEPLGYEPRFLNSLMSIMAGYLANLGVPRSGEFVRAGLLSKYEDMAPEKVMGTIVTDRIADVISLLVVIGIALILSSQHLMNYVMQIANVPDLQSIIYSPFLWLGLMLSIVLASGFIYILYSSQHQLIIKVRNILKGFLDGILSILKLKKPWLFILYSIGIWMCYYLMTYIIFFAFEPTQHLGPLAGLVVFVFGTFGILIPSPGGMGTYHYLITEGLSLYGIPYTDAFSLANILFFSVQILVNVLFGILSFIFLPIYNRNDHHS